MSKATIEELHRAYKPYDIVKNKDGKYGIIIEVSVNESQEPPHKIKYSIKWIGEGSSAWWIHNDLIYIDNVFTIIAEASCHNFSSSSHKTKDLFKAGFNI